MRIGIVTPGGFDRTGVERTIPVFNWIVERLARRHEVRVFTLYQEPLPSEFPLLGASIQNIGRSGGPLSSTRTAFTAVQAIIRVHKGAPFDVLHGLWAGESGLAAVIAARRLSIPSVVSVAGSELAHLPEIGYGMQTHWAGRARVRTALRGATAVIANSRYLMSALENRRPDARLIYNGADSHQFASANDRPPGPPWRLLHVASLNRVKDQPTLLRAMRRIRAAEPSATLDVVGEDTLGGAIQKLCGELGLARAVKFHGFKPSPVVADMMRRSHLLLHTSLHETGPVVFVEAAATGLPVVGTCVGMIDDFRDSLCVGVPVRDDDSLARSTIRLLRDATRRADLSQRLREWAVENNVDQTAHRWEELYNELGGGKNRKQPHILSGRNTVVS